MKRLKVAVIGRGVIGVTTALCALEELSEYEVDLTVYYDKETTEITSNGPPGLLRPYRPETGLCKPGDTRKWAARSMEKFVSIIQSGAVKEAGVHFVHGFVATDDYAMVQGEAQTYGDIVLNFKWMDGKDLKHLANGSYKYGVSFTTVASEARYYVPWLISVLEKKGARFVKQHVESLNQLSSNYDVIFNCSALGAKQLCGDDEVYPVRGVLLRLHAPWKKMLSYWGDDTVYQIPGRDVLYVGGRRQPDRYDTIVQQDEIDDMFYNAVTRDPSLKGAKLIEAWCGLRPYRKSGIRLEPEMISNTIIVHNYGHGGNGFCLSWGTGYEAVGHARVALKSRKSHL